MAFLTIDGLSLFYSSPRGEVRAVDNATLSLEERGTALGIIGETGSGKSSLAMSIARVLPGNVSRYEGRIVLGDTELVGLSNEEYRRSVRWKRVSVVFQGSMNGFNPVIKLGRQICEPLTAFERISKRAQDSRAGELLTAVGLPEALADRYPHELSGGMKQRAAIAMALIFDPELLILDEPTSALDVSVQAQIMNLLKRLKWETGVSMIFVTHDIALASELSDQIAVMYAGQVRESGSADHVLTDSRDPYSTNLIASMPTLHGKVKPGFVTGDAPDPVTPPSGCRFVDRCTVSFTHCREAAPEFYDLGDRHSARCFRQLEEYRNA